MAPEARLEWLLKRAWNSAWSTPGIALEARLEWRLKRAWNGAWTALGTTPFPTTRQRQNSAPSPASQASPPSLVARLTLDHVGFNTHFYYYFIGPDFVLFPFSCYGSCDCVLKECFGENGTATRLWYQLFDSLNSPWSPNTDTWYLYISDIQQHALITK